MLLQLHPNSLMIMTHSSPLATFPPLHLALPHASLPSLPPTSVCAPLLLSSLGGSLPRFLAPPRRLPRTQPTLAAATMCSDLSLQAKMKSTVLAKCTKPQTCFTFHLRCAVGASAPLPLDVSSPCNSVQRGRPRWSGAVADLLCEIGPGCSHTMGHELGFLGDTGAPHL